MKKLQQVKSMKVLLGLVLVAGLVVTGCGSENATSSDADSTARDPGPSFEDECVVRFNNTPEDEKFTGSGQQNSPDNIVAVVRNPDNPDLCGLVMVTTEYNNGALLEELAPGELGSFKYLVTEEFTLDEVHLDQFDFAYRINPSNFRLEPNDD